MESKVPQRFCDSILQEWKMGTKDLVRCSQLNLTFNQVECPAKKTNWSGKHPGPLAQLVEQRTFNPRVAGSSPVRPTNRSSNERTRNPLRKDQTGQAWPAGFLFLHTRPQGYNRDRGNGEETVCAARPLLPNHQNTAEHKRRSDTPTSTAPFPLLVPPGVGS